MSGSWRTKRELAKSVAVVFLPIVLAAVTIHLIEQSDAKDTFGLFVAAALTPLMACLALQAFALLSAAGTYLKGGSAGLYTVTPRGRWFMASGVAVLIMALLLRWASLGMLSVLALGVFYVTTTAAAVLAAYTARARRVVCQRRFSPTSVTAGSDCQVELDFEELRVPPFFLLLLDDQLPPQLDTRIRSYLPRTFDGASGGIAAPIRRTGRGVYSLPPPRVWYQDWFGLTRVPLPFDYRSAVLRILPPAPGSRLHRDDLRSPSSDDGLLSQVHRQSEEDFFHFREYVPGDDTRRINWKLSLRYNQIIVRAPESVPRGRRVQLILDTFGQTEPSRPQIELAMATHLDGLIEAWLAATRRFLSRGYQVSLVIPGSTESLTLKGSDDLFEARRWAAEASWQVSSDLDRIECEPGSIVFSGRIDPWPDDLPRDCEWVFLRFAAPAGDFSEPSWLARILLVKENAKSVGKNREALRRREAANRKRRSEIRSRGNLYDVDAISAGVHLRRSHQEAA